MDEKLKFKRKTEVHFYLLKQGFDVGDSKLNSKVAKDLNGIPKKDGYWLQKDVDNYIKYGKLKRMEGAMSGAATEIAEKIRAAELRIAEGKAHEIEHKNKVTAGRYVLKAEVESMLAARGKVLYDGVRSFGMNTITGIVEMVKGDSAITPEAIALFIKNMQELFHNYSKPLEFEVPAFTGEDEEETEK